jgi:glycosyltransferase involved in cell wall biosynthesis
MSAERVLVVVPCHDEEESLGRTLAEIRRLSPGVQPLVVDDGSSDRTSEVARAAGVPVIRHPINLGVGGALQTGFRYALVHGYDVAVQLDADGQHDPADLGVVLEPVLAGRADVAIGSRYLRPTGYRAPLTRRLGMLLFSAITGAAAGQLIALARRGFRLCEVPVTMHERRAGKSFYTLGKSLYYPYKNLLASVMAMLQRSPSR